jgi:hypothetical protein
MIVRHGGVFLKSNLQEVAKGSGDIRIIERSRYNKCDFRGSVLHQIESFIDGQIRRKSESHAETERRINHDLEIASGRQG